MTGTRYNPDDPIDRLAYAGAGIQERAPSITTDRVACLLEALAFPERFELGADGKVQKRGEQSK